MTPYNGEWGDMGRMIVGRREERARYGTREWGEMLGAKSGQRGGRRKEEMGMRRRRSGKGDSYGRNYR